jgi:hypothetical protein
LQKTKRLDLLLPANHEIFNYPSGSRRTIAAKYLDIGMQLSRIEKRLGSVEKSLADLNTVEISKKENVKSMESGKAKIVHNIIQGFGID